MMHNVWSLVTLHKKMVLKNNMTLLFSFKHRSFYKILPKVFILIDQISITYDYLRCHPHFCFVCSQGT